MPFLIDSVSWSPEIKLTTSSVDSVSPLSIIRSTSPTSSVYDVLESMYIDPPKIITSPVSVKRYPPDVTVIQSYPNIFLPVAKLEVETGLNNNYMAQKDMTEYLHLRFLDKWLYDEDYCYLLKYLIIADETVKPISNLSDFKENKICEDSEKDVEKKADYIEKNILGISEMKHILKRVIEDTSFKWYELADKDVEPFVMDVVEKFVKKRLKDKIAS